MGRRGAVASGSALEAASAAAETEQMTVTILPAAPSPHRASRWRESCFTTLTRRVAHESRSMVWVLVFSVWESLVAAFAEELRSNRARAR
jgi:hypothetical protein